MKILGKLGCFCLLICFSVRFVCAQSVKSTHSTHPNIIFILIDDMGYGDLNSYGNTNIETPNMDRLAKEGMKFTQFSVASPVCSPSRVAFITGQYPERYQIYGVFNWHEKDEQRDMPDWLDSDAPTVAKAMRKAGYATAHIGKWNMGGGHDIGDAPLPTAYGYDKTLVGFSGLGNRILVHNPNNTGPRNLNEMNAKLGRGHITWVDHRYQKLALYVDSTMAFIKHHKQGPFYVELFPEVVHDPWDPRPSLMKKLNRFANDKFEQQYYATVLNLDLEIGRLLDFLAQQGLAKNTIVFLSSDNGPTDWARYYKHFYYPPGSVGYFRGRKWSLYEGGFRESLLVRWPGHIPAGIVDSTTITDGIDVLPTLCHLANVPLPKAKLDGEDMSRAWLGHPQQRHKPLKWIFGFNKLFFKPGNPRYRSPDLAIRDGKWKLLINDDGSDLQLYNLQKDITESKNVAKQYPDVAKRLSTKLLKWGKKMLLKK